MEELNEVTPKREEVQIPFGKRLVCFLNILGAIASILLFIISKDPAWGVAAVLGYMVGSLSYDLALIKAKLGVKA